MSLAHRITRLPRPFDPAMGAEAAAAVPALTGDMARLVAGAGGSSPYLKSLLTREGDWLTAAADDPEAAVATLHAELRKTAPDARSDGLGDALRQAKRRIALITALADLGGVWSLRQVTGILSDFADLACSLAIRAEVGAQIRRGRLPGQGVDDLDDAGGMVVLAMGKMGARELNYSSDIDLICLFDETRFERADFATARQAFVRATRAMATLLSDRTAEGYVFRTDLRLRPDPSVTPVCIAMEAAERYYESLGRTWERAAFIKARAAAGDLAAGRRFLDTLRPFVWRRHLDYAAIEDAHNIRLRIRENKGHGGPLNLPGHDLKLGRGGIREIEFFTQTRQLIAGGRDPSLRCRETLEGLAALAAKGWVPEDVSDRLTEHYRVLRETEHRIQMVHDAQTHEMPKSAEGIARVACLSGQDSDALLADLRVRLNEVHTLTESFFAPGAAPRASAPTLEFDPSILARWTTYPALRSERAAHIFHRLRPEILSRLTHVARPDEALLALDGFLAGLPAGVQLFSLLDANPQLIDLLVDIAGTSPALAAHLSRNSAVFDAVIGGDFFAPWPGRQALQDELAGMLAAESDYESRLDAARRWQREWHFRIGVHLLRGLCDPVAAGAQYADLAGAVVAALCPVVGDEFARRHGPMPGRGAAVLAMGSLGAGRISATSDLDIIVIYDPLDAEMSQGRKPLPVRVYYARLTQAMITALSAPMAQGRLYEVDMRLRPSGNQGPVAASWRSFQDYQSNDAWTWEHLALTRARVIVGAPDLARDIETFRQTLLRRPRDHAQVIAEVVGMRARIDAAKSPGGVWDAKTGPGRMQDVELLAQTGALLSGCPARSVAEGVRAGVAYGWLDAAHGDALGRLYDLFWSVLIAARLVSGRVLEAEQMGEGGAAFMCRATGYDTIEALQDALHAGYREAAAIIDAALAQGADNGA